MFNLESSINLWREQMLAAGIQSPVPLDELESHLREEIQELTASGKEPSTAFASAVEKFGPARTLHQEFKKDSGINALSFHRFATVPGVLAVLWFAGCLTDLITVSGWFSPHAPHHNNLDLGLLNILVTGAGCAGSLLLFIGSKLGTKIVRSVALLYLVAGLAQSIPNLGQPTDWRIWCGCCAVFSLLTIWQLHRTPKQSALA